MKKCILLLLLAVATSLFAQDRFSCKISHDRKQLFYSAKEDEEKNILLLTVADFQAKSHFTVSYSGTKAASSRQKWIRTIAVYDVKDNELYKKESATVKIADTELKKMLIENKSIKIYTWALPKDPEEAARIRIRRVHLCTIVLQ